MTTGRQPLRAVNHIPISSPALELDISSPLAGQIMAGLQIHHPKGNKKLTAVVQFRINKPRSARIVLTVQHGHKTKAVKFPFGKKISGSKAVTLQMLPQEEMSGIHHISIHVFAQRKSQSIKVQLALKRLDISYRS